MAPPSERLAEVRAALRELEACLEKWRGREWPAPRAALGQARLPESYIRGPAGSVGSGRSASDAAASPARRSIVLPVWRQRLRAVVEWCERSWRRVNGGREC